MSGVRRFTAAIVMVAAVGVFSGAAPERSVAADPEFGVSSFTGGVYTSDGESVTQAGAHPDEASTTISWILDPRATFEVPVEDTKTSIVDLPPGFIGNPTAVPKCSTARFFDGHFCPDDTQVGVISISGGILGPNIPFELYNAEPPPGVAAAFVFAYAGVRVALRARVRTESDYGVTVTGENIPQAVPLTRVKVTIWGTPADPTNDDYRGCPGGGCNKPSQLEPKALLTNGTACTPPGETLATRLTLDSWVSPGRWVSAGFDHDENGNPVVVTGCGAVPFDPSLRVGASGRGAGSASGLDVSLRFPQSGLINPEGTATAALKRAEVTLPEGTSINPSAANGLVACSDAQLQLKSREPSRCPAASKLGTATATTPLLDETFSGGLYLRPQGSGSPESGEMYRVALVLEQPERGVSVRLPGQVRVDPATGRITAVFDNNPQVPVSEVAVKLRSGADAPLALPSTCGEKSVEARLTSWSGHVVTRSDSFVVDSGCDEAGKLSPALEAGTVVPVAGGFSPFVLRLTKPDGQRDIRGLEVTLPKGLTGRIADVPYCPEAALAPLAAVTNTAPGTGAAELASPSCPAASQVGKVTVGAGAGSSPFFVQTGRAYLAGPYKGAPLSLAIVTPAVAGPFDLGSVLVRSAIYVDRSTAQLTVVSDDIPAIVEGVPLKLRDLRVHIDRDRFTLNPTDCDPKEIAVDVRGQGGAVAKVASRFQVGDCAALPFKPRLKLSLTGRNQVRTGKHPGVKAVVRQKGIGEAGVRNAKVTLPRSLALDPNNAQALCEFEDGTKPDLENHCPKGSIVGKAKAKTPLLKDALSGNVYFVKNVKRSKTGNLIRTLPMIVVALRGQIAVNLVGKSSTSRDDRLVSTFATVPDAPIAQFDLNINGGSRGILAVTRTRKAKINLCAKPNSHIAANRMTGHNGKHADYDVRVKTPCAPKTRGKGKGSRH